MADVNTIPKIRCDNCGSIAEKVQRDKLPPLNYVRPRAWGSAKLEGSRCCDSYGGKSRLDFTDLCPGCAQAALDAAADALKSRRAQEGSSK